MNIVKTAVKVTVINRYYFTQSPTIGEHCDFSRYTTC